MNIQIPSHEKIKEVFRQGEDAVMALFDEFSGQLIELSQQLKNKAIVHNSYR